MVKIYFTSLLFIIFCPYGVYCELPDELIDLCANNNHKIDYNEYNTLKYTNCGCTDTYHCIRKCCQFGFFLNFTRNDNKDAKCVRNNSIHFSNFSVILYDGTRKVAKTNHFITGMLICNNTNMIHQYFKMNNQDPNEKVYLQSNGSLYFPNSKRKFYNNERYCVDEEDGLSVYLCHTPENPQRQVSRLVSSAGI